MPITTTAATARKVMTRRSIDSSQKPNTPKETNDSATSRAIRQPAMASPSQVARAVTPSQPISGTGRGRLGIDSIRCSQSTALRNPSARTVVNWMKGLVSRLAMTESRKPVIVS